jgi:hypothetical protein
MKVQVIISDQNADGTPYDYAVERFLADMQADANVVAGEPDAWDGVSPVLWFDARPWPALARCSGDFVARFTPRAIAMAVSDADAHELVTRTSIAGVVHGRSYSYWREPEAPGEPGWPPLRRRPGWGLAVPSAIASVIGASQLSFPGTSYSTIEIEGAETLPVLVREYLLAYDRAEVRQ